MGKDKSKTRDAKNAARFVSRGKVGIPELEGYYFGHGDERAGSRFNRVIEKLADYARIEYRMNMFYLILDGTELLQSPQSMDLILDFTNRKL